MPHPRRDAPAPPPTFRSTRRGLLLAAASCLLCIPGQASASSEEVPIGALLRDATLQGLNGPTRRLSSFRGKPLLINVWASWCGPCREEAASLERLAWGSLGAQFNLIGISTDDYEENAQAWLRQSHATLNHFIDQRLQMEHMLGASRLPLTVLVDAQGRVLEKIYGERQWDGPEATALLRRRFHLDGGPTTSGRTGWRNATPAPDMDQRRGRPWPV